MRAFLPGRLKLSAAAVAMAAVLVGGTARPAPTIAKGSLEPIWLVGGDLPHPVRIPVDELRNPGAGRNESYSSIGVPDGDLGPGYYILESNDLAAALSERGCCELFYPDAGGRALLRDWQAQSIGLDAPAEDRRSQQWQQVDGGLFDVIARYAALAKAGLIGEQPTFAEATLVSVRLFGVQTFLDGSRLPDQDARRLATSVVSLPEARILLPADGLPFPAYQFYQLWIHFGQRGTPYEGLNFSYAPPGAIPGADPTSGYLFPQIGPPRADGSGWADGSPPGPGAVALRSTPALDALLARYGAITDSVARFGVVSPPTAALAGTLRVAERIAGLLVQSP